MRDDGDAVDEDCFAAAAAADDDENDANAANFERPRGGEGAGEEEVEPEDDDDWTAARDFFLTAPEPSGNGFARCTSREEDVEGGAR